MKGVTKYHYLSIYLLDIRFEASVLRMEGRFAEAAELEKTIRRMTLNKVKHKLLGKNLTLYLTLYQSNSLSI
jgi:hypothetical protein